MCIRDRCVFAALVRVQHVVLLRSLSSATQIHNWLLPDIELLPCVLALSFSDVPAGTMIYVVTRRRDSGNRCNSAYNSRKPQKAALSATEKRARDYTLTPGEEATRAQRPPPDQRRRADPRARNATSPPAAAANPGVTPYTTTPYTTTPTIQPAPHRGALPYRVMHCPTTTRPSKKLRDHRRCSCGTTNAACAHD